VQVMTPVRGEVERFWLTPTDRPPRSARTPSGGPAGCAAPGTAQGWPSGTTPAPPATHST